MTELTYAKDLNAALRRCLASDPRVYIWGEDIVDPYGGAFKVTAGLSTDYPTRVLPTPISEGAIVGLAVGAAARGLLPVVEIMFGDFVLLAADQIVNHAAKLGGMYNGQVTIPLVVRTPMGGGRGYGPTHSQSLEKHLLGVPGLRVLAPSHFCSPGAILEAAVLNDPMPVLFIEHKLLYPARLGNANVSSVRLATLRQDGDLYPWVIARNFDPEKTAPDVTIGAYGGMSLLVAEALQQLADEEVWAEAYLPVELCPRLLPDMVRSVRCTRRLVLVEEGAGRFGWSAEVARGIGELVWSDTTVRLRCVEAAGSVVPCERGMETAMLPSVDAVIAAALETLTR